MNELEESFLSYLACQGKILMIIYDIRKSQENENEIAKLMQSQVRKKRKW